MIGLFRATGADAVMSATALLADPAVFGGGAAVVEARCKLLQKMLDELMALQEFASSPELGAFLFG